MPLSSFGSGSCIVRRQHPSNIQCHLQSRRGISKKIDGQENATPDDRIRRDSVDILVVIGVGIYASLEVWP
jgi:hypothetical protein